MVRSNKRFFQLMVRSDVDFFLTGFWGLAISCSSNIKYIMPEAVIWATLNARLSKQSL